MAELAKMQALGARPAPIAEIENGLMKFTKFKYPPNARAIPVTHLEADLVLDAYRYIRDTKAKDRSQDVEMSLPYRDLSRLRVLMAKLPVSENLECHREFAKEVFVELLAHSPKHSETVKALSLTETIHLQFLVTVLAETGESLEARVHVEQFLESRGIRHIENTNDEDLKGAMSGLWSSIMEGFAKEKNEEELLRTLRSAELAGATYNRRMQQALVELYAAKDDVLAVKAWYDKKPEKGKAQPTAACLSSILEFCMRKGEKDWCTSVFRSVIDLNSPHKPVWDVIFKWAAGFMGKGVEEVDRMMTVMVRRNPEKPQVRPDIDTINMLVELAHSNADPYLAERYITLGGKWLIRPNAKTFILQMDYRLDAGDLTGAQAAYEKLQAEDIYGAEDVPVVNKYIQKLCNTKPVKHDLIDTLVSELEERRQRLTGDTVIAVCSMHLELENIQDMIDVLQTHSYHLSEPERDKTREAFLSICYDRSTSTQRAWDVYVIVKHLFDEMSVEVRTQIMKEFFRRKRADYAIHVFGHMRQHLMSFKRPNLLTYTAAFAGFAQPGCANAEFLDTVHNMLKLDSSIDPNTKLYNSLMIAYTAIREPERAMRYWDKIANSVEGPTYASLEIVFRACETMAFGEKKARSIWSKMRRMQIEVIPSVFTAYVCALAGQGLEREAESLVEDMQADLGFGPEVMT